jgi:hypothetical protein
MIYMSYRSIPIMMAEKPKKTCVAVCTKKPLTETLVLPQFSIFQILDCITRCELKSTNKNSQK